MKRVVSEYPPVRLIKISDDTFAHIVDDWLIDFLDRYKKEIRLPFYCLMRSNTLTEEMAKRLSEAGCISIAMSVESGDERIRNDILKRGLTDKQVINSFRYARKYGIKTYGATLLAIPGATYEDDLKSFMFVKKLKMNAPTFGIVYPYPNTKLAEYAIKIGVLDPKYSSTHAFGNLSPFNCFTDKEKRMQLNLVFLGPIFCVLPDMFIPLFQILLRINAPWLYRPIGSFYLIISASLLIFPGTYPRNIMKFLRVLVQSVKYYSRRNSGRLEKHT